MLFKKLLRVVSFLGLVLLFIALSVLLLMLWIPQHPEDEERVSAIKGRVIDEVENFVQCVDDGIVPTRSGSRSIKHHFAFIGDSRMRQQFYSFIQTVVPDYDREWIRPEGDLDMILATCHCDLDVTSPLLGLRVSYRFRPLVDAALTDELELVMVNATTATRFILLGINAHHWLPANKADDETVYTRNLLALTSLIRLIDVSSSSSSRQSRRVMWMSGQQIIDDALDPSASSFHVSNAKIRHLNSLTRRLLRGSGIEWMDLEAYEYVRSCALNSREDDLNRLHTFGHRNCADSIHLGQVIISQTTRFLLDAVICPQG